ncbi:MAG: diacylglycerol kinase family protein [Gemmatimonadaceae bacterium]
MTATTPIDPSSAKAFLNAACGNASAARDALTSAGFELEEVQPKELESLLKKAISEGAERILVAGGDGTIATAASLVANTHTELAILPGGTLNHFAKDHGIPTDLGDAAVVAGNGRIVGADIGYVGKYVFLNTSSIGAYVTFVRVRERFEKRFGYKLASLLALLRVFSEIDTVGIELEVEGVKKLYRASLVFIGVGERELQLPTLGSRKKNGKRGLHVMIVQGRRPARLFAVALAGIARGTRQAQRLPQFESFVVDSCRINLARGATPIAVDGELKVLETPLEYRIERDALRLVVSQPKDGV